MATPLADKTCSNQLRILCFLNSGANILNIFFESMRCLLKVADAFYFESTRTRIYIKTSILHGSTIIIDPFRRVQELRNNRGVNRGHHRDMAYWKIRRNRNNQLVWIGSSSKEVCIDNPQLNWTEAPHDEFLKLYRTLLRKMKYDNLIESNTKIAIGHICESIHPDALKIKV